MVKIGQLNKLPYFFLISRNFPILIQYCNTIVDIDFKPIIMNWTEINTSDDKLAMMYIVMNNKTFGQRAAADIVGGRGRLFKLVGEGKIRAEKPTNVQNGKWFCNGNTYTFISSFCMFCFRSNIFQYFYAFEIDLNKVD